MLAVFTPTKARKLRILGGMLIAKTATRSANCYIGAEERVSRIVTDWLKKTLGINFGRD